jgi:hypothetical protein
MVAALGLGELLLLIVMSMLAAARRAQDIYRQLDQLNAYHQNVDATLRRLRSDVNLSGVFVRDWRGVAVALVAVFRLRTLERRSDEQRAIAQEAERQMRQLAQERDAAVAESKKLVDDMFRTVREVLTIEKAKAGGAMLTIRRPWRSPLAEVPLARAAG